MKKILSGLIAAALLCGCSAGTSDSSTASQPDSIVTEKETSRTASEILDLVAASGKAEHLDERADFGSEDFSKSCEKLYGVSPESLTDGGIMFSASGQFADEVSILKGADIPVLKSRAELRANDFNGYAPDEYKKAADAEVFEYGGFTMLIIADNARELRQLIENS